MPVNQDFKDIFAIFNTEKVDFIVVGAHAVMFHTEPRYTKDLDILVSSSRENSIKVFKALANFGAPMDGLSPDDFTDKSMIFQIGVEPNRIDILMGIGGVNFDEAARDAVPSSYDGEPIFILSKNDLIKSKKAADRPQDRLDIKRLESS